ncbi:Immunity protein 63 domain-containing protein [Gammaproteobacteria bacterium]
MHFQLDFENIIKQALTDWPKELDVSELQHASLNLDRYTVNGLGALSDEIEEKYIGKENEVIHRELHNAIYEVIHEAAKCITNIQASSIRSEAVRLVFERRLRKSASSLGLNWQPEDFTLVRSYFEQNSK